jgi:hypothetical protein
MAPPVVAITHIRIVALGAALTQPKQRADYERQINPEEQEHDHEPDHTSHRRFAALSDMARLLASYCLVYVNA